MQRTVAITGCSSGFGRILVQLFLKEGWQVLAGLRRAEQRTELFAEDQQRYKAQLHLLECDLQNEASVDAFAERCLTLRAGRLDALINNAGLGSFGPAELTSTEVLREAMETNFFGTVRLTRKLLPALRRSEGHIVVLSSILGLVGFPLTSTYCASKFALEGFFESLAYELAPQKIKVCLVEPGGHRTSFLGNSKMAAVEGAEAAPYQNLLQGYEAMQKQVATRKPVRPEAVCERILALVQMQNPPLRSICGKDAQGLRFLHKLLPRNLAARFLTRVYQKVLARLAAQGDRL